MIHAYNLKPLTFALARKLRMLYQSIYFAPCVVFLAMSIITFWSWQASASSLKRDINSVVNDRTARTQELISQRLISYEQILTGGAGLMRASQEVTANEWRNYVATFDVASRYSGVQGIGYIKTLGNDELPQIISYMQKQGASDFRISPDAPRDFYTAVLYQAPASTSSEIGLDMYTEPYRMKTMSRARDTGLTSLTPPLKSLTYDTPQNVLLLFVPQYQDNHNLDTVAERQQALRGFTYARLFSQDFFSKSIPDTMADDTHGLKITTSSETGDSTLYESPNYQKLQSKKGYVTSQQTLAIYGQTWNLHYSFHTSTLINSQRRNTPLWTALAGISLAFLLAEVVYLLLRTRSNELLNQKDQAVDLAKDELLSLASHQLRTPATTVKQYLGMVLQGFTGDITPTQHNLLTKAYAGNERQLYIINEMLHLAKIDSGRIVLAKRKTDINKLVRDIVQELQSEIDAANHDVSLKMPKKPINLVIDEHILRMAIENIISNAIKYTLSGGKIKISLQRKASFINIVVQDNGVGIAQIDIAKLYKLFTRLDNPQTPNVSGTGVGLYLAKHLVELHDGDLTVTSEIDKGSRFVISLPVRRKQV